MPLQANGERAKPCLKRAISKICSAIFAGLILAPLPLAAVEPQIALQHLKVVQADAHSGAIGKAIGRLEWLLLNDIGNESRTQTYQTALRQLVRQAPFSYGLSGNLLRSSNIKRTASQDLFHTDVGTFVIGDPDVSKQGFGLQLQAQTELRHAYAAGREITATLALTRAFYQDSRQTYTSPSVTVSHVWRDRGAIHQITGFANTTQYNFPQSATSPDNHAYGISASTTQNIGKGRRFSLTGTVLKRVYDEKDYSTGNTGSIKARYTFALGERADVSLSAAGSRAQVKADHLSYLGKTVGIDLHRRETFGLSWSVGLHKTWRAYDEIFTALSYARADTDTSLALRLSHSDLKLGNMTPQLGCEGRAHQSNVALYSYETFDCDITFKIDF
ncbi:uncharacterized protein DUF560 [Pacificibacter maritimus]|uniref:Uncharacterized protein DUF560 n=1 Tax=Pacificibacter maritimus TaxID=762213 RepID=A0A3N4UMM9_9RHOB|nr:surface lipoprotein assembly modifier [Pacificibacter maritimus]RPE66307.1 uncharacterized protein DUF560 [Pacificibacter maritimus]